MGNLEQEWGPVAGLKMASGYHKDFGEYLQAIALLVGVRASLAL